MARFSDEAIRAVVGKGRYSDPAAAEALIDALIKRRDRIKDVWLTGVNPIVNATLSRGGELRFENVAALNGVGGDPAGYTLRWSRFDNALDTHAVLGRDVTVGEARAQAPSAVLEGSDYVSVRIGTRHPRYPGWTPVQVYFRRVATGWQTVGLDRGLEPEKTNKAPGFNGVSGSSPKISHVPGVRPQDHRWSGVVK